jgi:hypothetical protein
VGGKVGLAGLSLDPPIIFKENFLYHFYAINLTKLMGGLLLLVSWNIVNEI